MGQLNKYRVFIYLFIPQFIHSFIHLFIYLSIFIQGRKEMFYLTTHSTHFIYDYLMSDIGQRTTQIAREETRCRHIGYSFRLTAKVLLCAQSRRQNTYHGLWYTSRGALVGREIAQCVHHEGYIYTNALQK